MSRVYFPTKNQIGLRDTAKQMTLGAIDFSDYRAPAEPEPHASMYPVNLGAVLSPSGSDYLIWRPMPVPLPPVRISPPVSAAPPTQVQSTPTPTVTVPPAPAPGPVLVTSGGGTISPGIATLAPPATTPSPTTTPAQDAAAAGAPSVNVTTGASASLIDQVAAWLGGTTPIGSYNIPNALLAGGVVIVVALLMGRGNRKR